MSAMARMQMVVELKKDSGFGYFDNIQDDSVFFPFCWIEEGIPGPSKEMARKVTKMLTMPQKVKGLAGLLGLVVGFLLLVPEIAYWIKSCFNEAKEGNKDDDEEQVFT